eukprot:CAMPEP_0170519088 /NCGR_PEP_ID=MMETSP0209-20121228/4623_1 /TAXON_ID=665100 ORGANISM="Litonotus pictus, Strain P1" /NCGR_SAMPLE_ID=MMETSP0209 /ASSEMBLY_ACC=CAM_ASM_000301 /LENGTH=1885 /DNA_ID=CAMNT_0010804883 /DNA_START=79 /DNA_END=5736 /DNA_ORIENTATION=-
MASTRPWCWTAAQNTNPEFKITPVGGLNWGYLPTGKVSTSMVNYTGEVQTSLIRKSGTNSDLYLKLYGDQGASGFKLLSRGQTLEDGSNVPFNFQCRDLGRIMKVELRITGNQCYRPKKVNLNVGGGNLVTFECLKRICPCIPGGDPNPCRTEIKEEGNLTYEVMIKTKDADNSGTRDPIHIFLSGSNGMTVEKVFSELGAERGSTMRVPIKSQDLGDIVGFRLKLPSGGMWQPSLVSVKSSLNDMDKTFALDDTVKLNFHGRPVYDKDFLNNPVLQNGGKSGMCGSDVTGGDENYFGEVPAAYQSWYKSSTPWGGANYGDDTQFHYETKISQKKWVVGAEGRTQVGALTDPTDRKNIINLKCDEKLQNPTEEDKKFGPAFPEGNAGFSTILAKCPHNCDQSTDPVYGVGIHPDISPVCTSAMVDKAIPPSGGIFAISTFPALTKYPLPPRWDKIGSITLKSYNMQAGKSYTVAKVDNIDMVEKDVRIVDEKGNITNEGRVEFRMQGYWGTLCFKGINDQAAVRICKDLDYNFGVWKNPTEVPSNDFCRSFKGEDYCGSKYTRSFFKELVCEQKDMNINQCNKKFANPDECTHAFDAIISCSNNDIQAETANNSAEANNGEVRMMANRQIDGEEIGRLEVYSKQKWGQVCDIGFSNDSADVVCRQMGFGAGTWNNRMDAKEWKKPTDDNGEFTASKLSCSGNEKTINECEWMKDNIKCKHDQDVVISCTGGSGDPSGRSQSHPKVETPSPDLGRLGMPYARIDCETTGRAKKYFRGDPGSVYLVDCPGGCTKRGSVYGTGVYSSDSNICLAACHAGVFECSKGGEAVLVKTYGQKFYEGSISNNVTSLKREMYHPVSYTFTSINSNYKNYRNLLYNNNLNPVSHKNKALASTFSHYIGKASEEINSIYTGTAREQFDYHGSQAVSNNPDYSINSDSHDARLDIGSNNQGGAESTGSLNFFSFLELGQEDSKFGPVAFRWVESVGTHHFNQFGKIIKTGGPIKSLDTVFTMFISFTLEEWRGEEAYILSYSGCGTFNIWINMKSTLIMGDPCNDKRMLDTGIRIPMKEKTIVYVEYDNRKVLIGVKSMTIKNVSYLQKDFTMPITQQEKLCIGCRASDESKIFFGDIDFIVIYEALVPKEMVRPVMLEIENIKKTADMVNNNPVTADGRKCLGKSVAAPVPGSPGAPSPPPQANPLIGIASPIRPPSNSDSMKTKGDNNDIYFTHPAKPDSPWYIQNSNNNKSSYLERSNDNSGFNTLTNAVRDSPSNSNAESALNKDEISNLSSVDIDCSTTAEDERFKMQIGKFYRISCGSCFMSRYQVIGSAIYHPSSAICRSAIHHGILPKAVKGDILMHIIEGRAAYNGEKKGEDIVSVSGGSAQYSFILEIAPSLRKIGCQTKGNEEEFAAAKNDSKFLVVCPKNCGKYRFPPIFGSKVYADLSPICMSAFHEGIIGTQGGNVQFMFSDGLDEYKGTEGFGLNSQDIGPQLRSYFFLGKASAIYHHFVENYVGRINKNWRRYDESNVEYENENTWNFFHNNDWINIDNMKEPMHTLQHIGRVRVKYPGLYYASILKYHRNEAEWANGVIKINLMFFGQEGRAAVLFRYQDKDNHYGLVFDFTDPHNNIKLYRIIEGSIEIVAGTLKVINTNVWYRIQIFLDYNNVRITMQTGSIRQHFEIFNKPVRGIQRGTLAVAVDYMKRVFFNGIEISKWSPDFLRDPMEHNHRGMSTRISQSLTIEKRKFHCRKMFKTNPNEIERCIEPHIYCKYMCDTDIKVRENISNYGCFSNCVKSIKNMSKPSVVGGSSWVPSIGEKVDYKQSGETMYIKAKVTSVRDDINVANGKVVALHYLTYEQEEMDAEEKWVPGGVNIKKCGSMLVQRNDCNSRDIE